MTHHTYIKYLLTGAAFIGTGFFISASVADTVDTADQATIYRDKMGVPHVYADTAPALYYGAGYAIAQDRLAEGETYMRLTLGRLAEILGPDLVEQDKAARLDLHTPAEIEAQLAALDKTHRDILVAMHAGWTAYVREVRADDTKLPYEFAEWGIKPTIWTLTEFLDVMGGLQRGYGSGGGGHELENLAFLKFLTEKYGAEKARVIFDDVLPLQDADAPPIINPADEAPIEMASATPFDMPHYPEALQYMYDTASVSQLEALQKPAGGASRVLMVGASKSADGVPMMLHATADGPDVHLSGAGFNVAGFVLPPICPIIMGRTPENAFSFTTGESDLIDIFEEKINSENPQEYWYDGAWRAMTVRPERILVKGQDPVEFSVERTVHGPVIARDVKIGAAYTRKNSIWGHELKGLAAMIDLNKAQDLPSYLSAAKTMQFNFNVNYAGTDGHIALFHSGNLPVRAEGFDPRLPVPGDGRAEWLGFLPQQDHPQVIDPETGYIHAWNNKPTADSTYGDTSRYGKTFRSWLGNDLMQADESVTRDEVLEVHRKLGLSAGAVDLSVTNPAYFTPYLMAAAEEAEDEQLVEAVGYLAGWDALYADADGNGSYDSVGLTIYRAWITEAQKRIIGDDIGQWWHKVDDTKYVKYRTEVLYRAIAGEDAGTPMGYDWFNGKQRNALLTETLKAAVDTLTEAYGTDDMKQWLHPVFWTYFDAAAVAENPDKPPYPIGEVFGSTAGRLGLVPESIPANLSEGWSMLVKLDDKWPDLYDATPSGGQNQFISTEGEGNPNIADQVMLHKDFKFKTVRMEEDTVKAEAVSKQVISVIISGQ